MPLGIAPGRRVGGLEPGDVVRPSQRQHLRGEAAGARSFRSVPFLPESGGDGFFMPPAREGRARVASGWAAAVIGTARLGATWGRVPAVPAVQAGRVLPLGASLVHQAGPRVARAARSVPEALRSRCAPGSPSGALEAGARPDSVAFPHDHGNLLR